YENQSSIGVMMTSVNRRLDPTLSFLAGAANTVGTDWDLRFLKRYAVRGYWVGSSIRGTPEAIDRLETNSRHYFQRPDLTSASLDPTRTSLNGEAGSIAIQKIGGEHTRFNTNYTFKSTGFDVNDVGYMQRADQRNLSNWFQVRSDTPNHWSRSRM